MLSLLLAIQNKAVLVGALFSFVALNPGCERATQGSPPEQVSQRQVTTPPAAPASTSSSETKSSEESSHRRVAIIAGGCFWGMEELLREIPGVVETDVGYIGGAGASPSYEQVKTGRSGHAEAVRVVFDPSRLQYADLLENWFFRMHDPTTLNSQGNDVGSQYRSTIFYTSESQRETAEGVKKKVNESGKWSAPLVTTIVEAGPFTPAEDYHQDYLQKHPGGYSCHFMRDETL